MEINTELLRWILLIGAAPIWWPFLRTLWRDFDEALAEEGGVFGRTPSARELEEIRRKRVGRPDPLISEPWVRRDQPRAQAAPAARGKKHGFR
jgi:hypothetical protein